MRPVDFKESNGELVLPHHKHKTVPVFMGEYQNTVFTISVFVLEKEEIVHLMAGGKLWLLVSHNKPPVCIPSLKSPFVDEEKPLSPEN